jgi:hypothetical protein
MRWVMKINSALPEAKVGRFMSTRSRRSLNDSLHSKWSGGFELFCTMICIFWTTIMSIFALDNVALFKGATLRLERSHIANEINHVVPPLHLKVHFCDRYQIASAANEG